MDNEMNQSNNRSWNWLAVAAIAVLIAVGAWMWWARQAAAPGASETAGPALGIDDTSVAIEQELNATDFGNLESELQSTEADLQSL